LKVRDTKFKNEKLAKRVRGHGQCDLNFKFWDPLDIFGMAKDTDLKFCMRINHKGY